MRGWYKSTSPDIIWAKGEQILNLLVMQQKASNDQFHLKQYKYCSLLNIEK